jgi:hypothetical protein
VELELTEKKIPDVSPIGLSLWLNWLIANAAGLTIGMAIPGWWWVLSNTIGWSAAWVIINLQVGYSLLGLGITEFSIVRGTVAGILVGLLQWLILRQLFYRAGWWILVSPLGWGIGMAVGVTVGGAFGWPLVGAISGIIAGYPLIWILRQPRR